MVIQEPRRLTVDALPSWAITLLDSLRSMVISTLKSKSFFKRKMNLF